MYLCIRNPGVADPRAFTLIGASTTRSSTKEGSIGQFGSGTKHAIALLLRYGIRPVIYPGNLKMEFYSKPETIKGSTFNRVCINYGGKDEDGRNRSGSEDTSFTLEWGVQDWKLLNMALREFVANAIDGSLEYNNDFSAVEMEIVDKPRAKSGYTSVYIPYEPKVEEAYRGINTTFLHFANPELLNHKLLPKRNPDSKNTLIYKKGVLVSLIKSDSVYDYNLGPELTLDESRNANEWEVKYAIAQALQDAEAEELMPIISRSMHDEKFLEGTIDASYIETNSYDKDKLERRSKEFIKAFKALFGENAVVTGSPILSKLVKEKGFEPVVFANQNWLEVLKKYKCPSDGRILSKAESEGKVTAEPTEEMLKSLERMWGLIWQLGLTNDKDKPTVKSFYSIMDAGAQTFGYYIPGDSVIYLHKDLGGELIDKVTCEELSHYISGASDNSRDFQDYLFRIIMKMYVAKFK